MKVLYACMKYDYGDPDRGLGYEYYNFYLTFKKMGLELVEFDCMTILKEIGKKKMNLLLWETVQKEKPDLLICAMMRDEFQPNIIQKISQQTSTITYNWFSDDHWRYDNFSKNWAPMFNWVSTTDQESVVKYHKDGYDNIIKTQWGFNPDIYRREDTSYKYDVTFIGQVHSNRKSIINSLKKKGIRINCFGAGWPEGRIEQDEMVTIFNQSKINLNLNNSSTNKWYRFWKNDRDQIKGRNFEVPGSGSFLLTGEADDLEKYFDLEKEVGLYHSESELSDRINYYLECDSAREAIKASGYKRCQDEHSYTSRFEGIFDTIFSNPKKP